MPFKFNPITHEFNIASTTGGGSGFIATLTGDIGGPVGPDGVDNINIIGSGPITVTGNAGTNTLTIGSVFPFLTWSVIVANQMAITQEGYFTNGGSRVEVQLPNTSVIGDTFVVSAINSNGWRITQGAGQNIRLGNQVSTTGVSGYVESTFIGDSITLICSVANTEWNAPIGSIGNITIV
jgi:hypothetical protein